MTPIWFDKLSILYERKYLMEVFPHKNFDLNRKLNGLLRLSIYYAAIIYFTDRKKKNVFYVPLIVAVLSYIINRKYDKTRLNHITNQIMNGKESQELIDELKSDCRVPTKDNPFMNPSLSEIGNNKEIQDSCVSYNNKGLQRVIEKQFNEDLYRDPNDIFGKNNSQRQYYSVPSITGEEQGKFANWLYATPPTCKEGNGLQCAANQSGMHIGVGSPPAST
jgi:hypothetical protein